MRIIILFLISSFVYAQQCEPEEFKIVFSNGELTTPKQAFTTLNELALNLGNKHNNENITYDLAYNYSDAAFKAILQTSNQNLWYIDLARLVYNWSYQVNTLELNQHIEKYREAILHGQKILVVSHSQGNFYTNLAQQMLINQKPAIAMNSFGSFGIATPTNTKSYLTNHLDIITTIPNSPSANWTLHRADNGKIVSQIGSIPAHSMNDTYLSPYYDTRPELINGIKQELSKLVKPPKITKSGSITVTLTWDLDEKNDIDLHILEPNNTHVYFENQTGKSGYLDVDNRQGFGPEHYYTDCKKLQIGEYLVGIKYYSDSLNPSRPVKITTTISIPGSTRTFITKLEQATGHTNSDFIKLAKVIIGKNTTTNRLKYQIIPIVIPNDTKGN